MRRCWCNCYYEDQQVNYAGTLFVNVYHQRFSLVAIRQNHSKMPTPYGSRLNGINGLNYLSRGGIQATPGHLPTEPMSLGSPPTSPNAMHVHGAAMGTQYLPGFLMGDAIPSIQNPTFSPNGNYPNSRPLQLPSAPVSPPLGTPKQNQVGL